MKLNYLSFSSIKSFDENFNGAVLNGRRNELIDLYGNQETLGRKVILGKKKHTKYCVDGILEEVGIVNPLDQKKVILSPDEYKEKQETFFNLIISRSLGGNLIPPKGFHISTVNIIPKDHNNTWHENFVYDLDIAFPCDNDEISSVRSWRGIGNKNFEDDYVYTTIVYRVPFKFLSSKLENSKSHPPRGDFWVYRLRFYITDHGKLDEGTINVYQNGYVGVTSRNPFERFGEHHWGYVQRSTKSLYISWDFLDKHNINHVVSFEILDRCNTREEMFELEQSYINELDTLKNGFNTIPGGNTGDNFLKSLGLECDDLENKDDFAAKFYDSPDKGRKPHYVREHMREYKKGSFTYVRGHFKNLPKDANEILEFRGHYT